jgi:cellulose 1,4-beta-cellobiosidase
MRRAVILFSCVAVRAQQVGTNQAETHPPLTTYECTAAGCEADTTTTLTLDSNWRWTHQVGSSTNCYTGDEWDTGLCPDPVTCVLTRARRSLTCCNKC